MTVWLIIGAILLFGIIQQRVAKHLHDSSHNDPEEKKDESV